MATSLSQPGSPPCADLTDLGSSCSFLASEDDQGSFYFLSSNIMAFFNGWAHRFLASEGCLGISVFIGFFLLVSQRNILDVDT